MSTKRSLGYVRLIIGGLILLLAGFILLTNIRNTANVHLLVRSYPQANVTVVMLLSAVTGMLLYVMVSWVVRGLLDLRETRGEVRPKQPRTPSADSDRPAP